MIFIELMMDVSGDFIRIVKEMECCQNLIDWYRLTTKNCVDKIDFLSFLALDLLFLFHNILQLLLLLLEVLMLLLILLLLLLMLLMLLLVPLMLLLVPLVLLLPLLVVKLQLSKIIVTNQIELIWVNSTAIEAHLQLQNQKLQDVWLRSPFLLSSRSLLAYQQQRAKSVEGRSDSVIQTATLCKFCCRNKREPPSCLTQLESCPSW